MDEALKLAKKLMDVTGFRVEFDPRGTWHAEMDGIDKETGYAIDYTGAGKTVARAVADLRRYLKHRIKTGKDLSER